MVEFVFVTTEYSTVPAGAKIPYAVAATYPQASTVQFLTTVLPPVAVMPLPLSQLYIKQLVTAMDLTVPLIPTPAPLVPVNYTAAAPPAISDSSWVIAACRALL